MKLFLAIEKELDLWVITKVFFLLVELGFLLEKVYVVDLFEQLLPYLKDGSILINEVI
jgi:hypothetical protein